MCHAVRVKLSPAERKAARRFAGVMVPVYASLVLFALAAVALSSGPRPGETIAVAQDVAPLKAAAGRAAD